MKALTSKDILPELKRRIKGALSNILDRKLTSDNIIVNNTHTIHFMIRNKDYLIQGIAIRKIKESE